MIKFKNVKKDFKGQRVIEGINFEVKKGEIVVLVGPSGCGKTTTLKMINRLVEPTSGIIEINGEDILKKDVIKLRRNIGYVIQQTGLFPHMTIKENIELISMLEKKDPKQIEKKTIEVMEVVGLDAEQFLYRYPNQLSGGQQQRVGVARAFSQESDLILMDEPFSALDPITREQLQDELLEIQTTYKKTIVFVTHDMDEAVKIADRICIMNKGKIAQYDTPENILKLPKDEFVTEFVGKNRIWSAPELIKAKDIMITEPIKVKAEVSILKCIERMRITKVDSLLITDKNQKLLGIITAKKCREINDKNILVKDVMNDKYFYTLEDDSIVDLLQIVQDNELNNMPVLNSDGVLVGLITTTSLLTTLSQQYIESEEVV